MQLNYMSKNAACNISFNCHLFPARSAQSRAINSFLSTINEHTYGHDIHGSVLHVTIFTKKIVLVDAT